MGSCNNKDAKKTHANFHQEVVSLLCEPKPESQCSLKLAYYFADIVREFTGDEIVQGCQAFAWPEKMDKRNTTTISTRRTRLLDRMVRYSVEYGFSHAEVYNCFYAVSPNVENIVALNKGQEWESHNDWMIYDIFAKLVLLCHPTTNKQLTKDRANALLREIDSQYNPQDARKIKEMCKYLELELRKTPLKYGKHTFGEWVSKCLEHFCAIALNEAKVEASEEREVLNTAHMVLHFSMMHPKLWFRSPFEQVAAAANSACTFQGKGTWGNWFRVQYRTAVRDGILLDSTTVGILNPGELVHIVQGFGRRVQVDAPMRGFCSLHDGAGLQILTPVEGEDLLTTLTGLTHESMQSPYRDMTRWIFTERTNTYASLKEKFADEAYSQVGSMSFSNGRLVQADATMTE